MKKSLKIIMIVALIVAFVMTIGFTGCKTTAAAEETTAAAEETTAAAELDVPKPNKDYVIGFTPNTLEPPWAEAIASVENRIKEINEVYGTNVTVTVKAPATQSTINEQSVIFDDFISSKVDVIIGIAADPESYAGLAKRASDAGIPVGVVLEMTTIENVAFRVFQEDVTSGNKLGERIVEDLGGKGNIAFMHGKQAQSVDVARSNGVMGIFEQYPDIKIIAEQEAGWSMEPASKLMDDWITGFGDDIDAVVALNDNMALGALASSEAAGKTYYITGWDGSVDAVNSVMAGKLKYTMDIDFTTMGKLIVDASIEVLNNGSTDYDWEYSGAVIDQTNAATTLSRIEGTLRGEKQW